jgi:hypothetical protein
MLKFSVESVHEKKSIVKISSIEHEKTESMQTRHSSDQDVKCRIPLPPDV